MNIILIILGIVLIIINLRPKKDTHKNEFNKVLHNQDNIIKDYDIELMAIRKDMAESILDLQQEINELREKINLENNIKESKKVSDKEIENVNDEILSMQDKMGDDYIVLNDKVNIIKNMILQGHSDEEICEKLKVGKGEVLLIKGLFK